MTRSPGFWLAGAACIIVAAAVVGGLLVVGGPGEARLEKLDAERTDDLRAIERELDQRQQRGLPFPASLDAFEQLPPGTRTDPVTEEPYPYRLLPDSTVEVCATFERASGPEERVAYEWSDIGPHEAGRHCFTLYPGQDR